ncbi:FMN-dependent dehydrogenase-domain-containing protein [Penicillium hetheringtonii]|uniref:FMN-dependent dehydrogenase-domain-containing protein n=1 Tax=Penicillium hetheringtonii TaxID=911720 RepID=A0AAD6DJA2_9EURO|nr:FMN-dependent dehydrogenase-domain-containing protein [Penicillium hetheringtonii]
MARKVSTQEIAKHTHEDDIWIVVNGKVYDVTKFAPSHPGGAEIIYSYAGRDASKKYNSTHSPSLISDINESIIGDLDESTITENWYKKDDIPHSDSSTLNEKPALNDIINLDDFESVAMKSFSPKSWAYHSGAANDCITRDENREFLRRIWLRPAIMRDVSTIKTKSTLFGCNLDIPVFIAPVGAAKMSHEEGELPLTRGAASSGIIHCISTMASYSLSEILDQTPSQAFYQLYINKDRSKTEDLIRLAEKSGKVKALFVTADLPVMSKREADERIKLDEGVQWINVARDNKSTGKKSAGLAKANSSFIDSSLNWEDLRWLRSISSLPIVLKGVQRAEDARLAMRAGFNGIVISNHGGACGGYYGTDNLGFVGDSQAICLGASAVGLGRSFAYALNYGQSGVEHAVDLIKEEIHTAAQLVGMTDLFRDANPRYINTAAIDHLLPPNYGVSADDVRRRLNKL